MRKKVLRGKFAQNQVPNSQCQKKKKEKEIKQYLQDAKVGIETGDKFYADF